MNSASIRPAGVHAMEKAKALPRHAALHWLQLAVSLVPGVRCAPRLAFSLAKIDCPWQWASSGAHVVFDMALTTGTLCRVCGGWVMGCPRQEAVDKLPARLPWSMQGFLAALLLSPRQRRQLRPPSRSGISAGSGLCRCMACCCRKSPPASAGAFPRGSRCADARLRAAWRFLPSRQFARRGLLAEGSCGQSIVLARFCG